MKKADPAKLSPDTRNKLFRELQAVKASIEPRAWEKQARPKQLPPDHPRHHLPWKHPVTGEIHRCQDYNPDCTGPSPDWTTWIWLAGRGCGKTLAGAQWSIAMALSEPDIYVAVCAPTYADVQRIGFEGQSGILRSAQPGEVADYNKNNLTIKMRNGSIIQGFSAEKADSIRGMNLSYCWFDELAMIRYMKFFDFGLKPALRVKPKGSEPRLMITTTPKNMKLIRKLVKQAEEDPAKVHITRAISEENPYFSAGALTDLRREYKGTYMERQELEGELITESDGAMFRTEDFNEFRIEPGEEPEFRRIVVAIDPATSASDTSDETGIVVAGESSDHHFYTLEDCSMRGTAEQQMSVVAGAYRRWDADVVVGESNGVKDYLRAALAVIDPNIPLKLVPAMKGKLIRAQPVSILASQGRIHMVGTGFDKLEEQLSSMTPDDDRSLMHDDRADAWVWAMRELTGSSAGSYKEAYGFFPCTKCGRDVNERTDKTCRNCGTEYHREEKEKSRDRSVRWSNAYMNTCMRGHEYPMRLKSCPECKGSPEVYMAQVAKITGAGSQWLSYTGKNWRRT